MKRLDLSGAWTLQKQDGTQLPGHIPGCNYLDLLAADAIPDPFYGLNEFAATKIAEEDWLYLRQFEVSAELLARETVELVLSGVDTLAEISLNGKALAQTNNSHRSYRFAVKALLREGENTLSVLLRSPVKFALAAQEKRKMPGMAMGIRGIAQLRKPQCHFGWDWGPILPPSGITGEVALEVFDALRIADCVITQTHTADAVTLRVRAETTGGSAGDGLMLCSVTAPDGEVRSAECILQNGSAEAEFRIENPQLWWCKGLGEQPLYAVTIRAELGTETDELTKNIGLRTITLNTDDDKWGRNFCFSVNGVPIFAKGANWIPADSFINRQTPEQLEWYIKSAADANMNMLRIWGGGYYESDLFYALCDQYGILIWQDFGFACALYPLDEPEFLENVHQEVIDNVKRLRHHASLALWCGNNEIQMSGALWRSSRQTALYAVNNDFFFRILRGWVGELDAQTVYWPGSPSAGISEKDAVNMHKGDAHLWTVWHGMRPIEAYRKMPARFCSEYGMESFPSMETLRTVTDEPESSIFSPVMLSHQKCGSGNAKILYYLLAKYRNPASLADFVYLSQLMQAETMRYATEFWRRSRTHCHGSLYWQYNDCWPVASWAGIDYGQRYKALQYLAKRFNAMQCVCADLYDKYADFYVINDCNAPLNGYLHWRIVTLDGKNVKQGKKKISVPACEAHKVTHLAYRDYLKKGQEKHCALLLRLTDADGNTLHEQRCLPVPDKESALQKPKLATTLAEQNGLCTLTLCSNTYARFVRVEFDGLSPVLSDNYFDLPAGEPYSVTFELPQGTSVATLEEKIRLHSLADVAYKGSAADDKRIRLSILLNPKTHLTLSPPKFGEDE